MQAALSVASRARDVGIRGVWVGHRDRNLVKLNPEERVHGTQVFRR